ncbi:YveK family protein [Herpetosiphon giganteus]|uniref:YveK family protein n=1 Tax=Herpetosiphon giganteus TaxID=2029754 RepID=UPI00195A7AAF|nr:diguanylate cyclase [Herpetosiphon giganteus]MBM7843055.1 diguanylate cyclase (GGDEF)-like protein [Herpetosiphon giganteus]
MEFRHYLRMLGRGWWLIALAALTGATLALARSYVTEPEYRTRTRLLLSPNLARVDSGQELYSVTTLQNRTIVNTIAEILNSGSPFKETGGGLNLPPSEVVRYKNNAVTVPEANVLEVYVDGPDANTTALLANSLAQRTIDFVDQKYPSYSLTVLDPALPSSVPQSPKPVRDTTLALILGAVVGAIIAIVQAQLKTPLEALRRRSTIDAISTAFTRRHFDQQAKDALGRSSIASLGLVYLDGMQDVIDSMPAPVVQRVLRHAKNVLRNELRGNDIIGRWDNTTFSILLPETPEIAATRTLDRILNALDQPVETGIDDVVVKLTPYAGGATRRNNMAYGQLVEEAEAALTRSYRSGEKNVLFSAVEQPA